MAGDKLVNIENIETGVTYVAPEAVYLANKRTFRLVETSTIAEATVESKIEDVMEEVEEILQEVKKTRKPRTTKINK